jgi:hypothetical protein
MLSTITRLSTVTLPLYVTIRGDRMLGLGPWVYN